MGVWIERAQKLLRYMSAFGGAAGTEMFLRTRRRRGLVELHLPGMAHPFSLRAKTADVHMFEEVFVDGEYRIPETPDPQWIVDAGAHIGCASVFFAVRHPDARIVAIEPESGNLELLRRNTAPYPNIEVVAGALWHERATLSIEDGGNSSAFRVREGPGDIPAMTLPDVLRRIGASRVDILKMDVEGAEKEIFAEPPPWLADVGVLMIELHDRFRPGCSRNVFTALGKHDFREMRHQTASWFVNGAFSRP